MKHEKRFSFIIFFHSSLLYERESEPLVSNYSTIQCTSKQRNKQIYSYLITKNFSCKEMQEKNFHLFSLEMMYRRIYKIA